MLEKGIIIYSNSHFLKSKRGNTFTGLVKKIDKGSPQWPCWGSWRGGKVVILDSWGAIDGGSR